MAFKANQIEVNARLKARHELETGKNTFAETVVGYLVHKRGVKKKLMDLFLFDEQEHSRLFKKATIVRTNGCHCMLCTNLAAYVRAKLYLHKFKKSYYDPWGVTSHFKMFDDAYTSYKSGLISGKYEEELSEEEFFGVRAMELKSEIQELRATYQSTEAAIKSLLKTYQISER